MGGSAAGIPTPPDERPSHGGLRASDADRDEVASRLKDEFVAGRLSHDTFLHRMSAVFEARQHGELSPLLEGLPSRPQPVSALQATGRSVAGWFRGAWSRVSGSADAAHDDQGNGPRTVTPAAAPARVTTSLQAAVDVRRPRPLQFPRGSADQFSIGRDASCDLAIADMTVSRRHATLERTADGWLLTDLESTNGTRVNGWRVRGKVSVTPGDLVSFGNSEYSLC
jgi:pSer/pThr/pTyr-binding forkhead associated (FHA) protein